MRVTNKPKRLPTSIGNRFLIKTFYALCKKEGSNSSIFSKLCVGGAGRRAHKAWLSLLCTSLSTAHRVYFSQIKISRSVLLLAGWCVEVRGGVCGRGRVRSRPRRPGSHRVSRKPGRTHRHVERVNHARYQKLRRLSESVGHIHQLLYVICGWILSFIAFLVCCAVTRAVLCALSMFGQKVVSTCNGECEWNYWSSSECCIVEVVRKVLGYETITEVPTS